MEGFNGNMFLVKTHLVFQWYHERSQAFIVDVPDSTER